MTAAQTLELPPDTGLAVIVTVRSTAPDVVRAADRRRADGDLDGWARDAFECGARALEHARGDAGAALLALGADAAATRLLAATQAATQAVTTAVHDATSPGGTLAIGVGAALEALREDFSAVVADAGGTLTTATEERLVRATETAATTTRQLLAGHSDTLRALVTGDHPGLAALGEQVRAAQEETRRMLADLLARVEARDAAAAVTRGTATKGADTEAAVVNLLSRIALGHEDVPEATGTHTGMVDGRRVGDWVSQLSARAGRGQTVRVVAEVKDGRVSLPALGRELALALENRGASAGLAVVRTDGGFPGGRRVVVLGQRTVAVCWTPGDTDDLLAACYAVCLYRRMVARLLLVPTNTPWM